MPLAETSCASDRLIFPPWTGEFGWEVMCHAPLRRRECREADKRGVITTYPGMGALYDDFADCREHDPPVRGRACSFTPKVYRVPHRWHRLYGQEGRSPRWPILLHARRMRRKQEYNYRRWEDLLGALASAGIAPRQIGFVGTRAAGDWAPSHGASATYADLRDIGLDRLMGYLAGARVVAGVSSGTMHLAAACGAPLVVWGQADRQGFGESLERRYRETWNPHAVPVRFIDAPDWQPPPAAIADAVAAQLE